MFAAALASSPWNQTGANTYNGKTASQIAALTPLEASVNATGEAGQVWNDIWGGVKNLPLPLLGPGGPTVGNADNAAHDVKKATTSVGQFLGDITNPTTLKNVGIFAAGLALVGVGLLVFFATTKPGQDAAKAAKDGAIVAT